MPILERFGAIIGTPLRNRIANRLAQITERLNPPSWLPVTDSERQKTLTEQLERAWSTYQIEAAQDLPNRAGTLFFTINKPDARFPEPTIAVLGGKPTRVYDTSYDLGISFALVPATVVQHPSADKKEVGPQTYIIYNHGKPHAFVTDSLGTYTTADQHAQPGARLRLDSNPLFRTISEPSSLGGLYNPVPTYCSLDTLFQTQKMPEGTHIVPSNSMLILGQPSLFEALRQQEEHINRSLYRRPFAFLWVEQFQIFPFP